LDLDQPETSSDLLEAHRIENVYVKHAKFRKEAKAINPTELSSLAASCLMFCPQTRPNFWRVVKTISAIERTTKVKRVHEWPCKFCCSFF
jgi:hypothetical protein